MPVERLEGLAILGVAEAEASDEVGVVVLDDLGVRRQVGAAAADAVEAVVEHGDLDRLDPGEILVVRHQPEPFADLAGVGQASGGGPPARRLACRPGPSAWAHPARPMPGGEHERRGNPPHAGLRKRAIPRADRAGDGGGVGVGIKPAAALWALPVVATGEATIAIAEVAGRSEYPPP